MMRCSKYWPFLLLIGAITWAAPNLEPHDFENKCLDCHVGLRDPGLFTKTPDVLCLSCHPEQKEKSHPTDIIVRSEIPEKFPLYKGKLVCFSCHIAHKTYDKANVDRKSFDNNPYLLRATRVGKVFCYQCHRDNPLNNKIDSHAVAFKKAHTLNHDMSLKEVLDDDSLECLSCHDGILSGSVNVRKTGVNWEHARGVGVSHPIGIDYSQVYTKDSRHYHPSTSLDPRIRLINGKIGCRTCHDHYSKLPYLLVFENRGSKLCLQCHNL